MICWCPALVVHLLGFAALASCSTVLHFTDVVGSASDHLHVFPNGSDSCWPFFLILTKSHVNHIAVCCSNSMNQLLHACADEKSLTSLPSKLLTFPRQGARFCVQFQWCHENSPSVLQGTFKNNTCLSNFRGIVPALHDSNPYLFFLSQSTTHASLLRDAEVTIV